MEADKLTSLAAALEYVEQNLTSDFSQEKCARYACCSLSGLQKLFRSVFRRSVGDYVARRRLTAAGSFSRPTAPRWTSLWNSAGEARRLSPGRFPGCGA